MTEITHSLLSSWLWSMEDTERDTQMEFLQVLRREPTEATPAMLDGIEFEDLVSAILSGGGCTGHKWYTAAAQAADLCRGGQLQLTAKREMEVNGYPILLYGRLDCLRAGVIYDIKFSRRYERGKYCSSTQHPAYMNLVPEAGAFTYIISDGRRVYTETYRRDETPDIRQTISEFLCWLQACDLIDLYRECWKVRG